MIHASAAKLVGLGLIAAVAGGIVEAQKLNSTAGCGGNTVPVVTNIGAITVCVEKSVLKQVAAGLTTFEEIAVAVSVDCGPIAAADIAAIISLWTGGSLEAGTMPLEAQQPAMQAKLKALHYKSAK